MDWRRFLHIIPLYGAYTASAHAKSLTDSLINATVGYIVFGAIVYGGWYVVEKVLNKRKGDSP